MNCAFYPMASLMGLKYADEVAIPRIFGDHMVLQRDRPIPIWGTARPGGNVIVRLGYQKRIVSVDSEGCWFVEMPSMKPSGPHEMVVFGKNVIRFRDIYIGDVWLCSGQSNMELPVSQSNEAEKEIENANYPKIRFLQVDHCVASHPLQNIDTKGWQICSPISVQEFSAAGYYFGREIYEQLQVPIGLIQATWGGSVAEAWMSQTGLIAFPEFTHQIQLNEDRFSLIPSFQENEQNREKAHQAWIESLNALDMGQISTESNWQNPGMLADDWSSAQLPGIWEKSEIGNYDGIVWYRKTVNVPDSLSQMSWTLSLGCLDDMDQTWINGIKVGEMENPGSFRKYQVSDQTIHSGINVIVVRIFDLHGDGGFVGPENEMFLLSENGEKLPLTGEWKYKLGIEQEKIPPLPLALSGLEKTPVVLFNAMIHPVVHYAVRGVIWYQGEENVGRAEQYRSLFPALIEDWRSNWNYEIPFLFVQLPNYHSLQSLPEESDWAELREAQTMALSLPNTGMAVTIDLGDPSDIHPRNKQDVGKRLAVNALANVYQKDIEYSGPVYKSMRIEDGQIRLYFMHVNGGFVVKGSDALKGFAIAGEDHKFVWADAKIEGQAIIVSSQEVKEPLVVRYAWADNPIANLYNKAGLPASPFRTDGANYFNSQY